jgi:hypothetical protein
VGVAAVTQTYPPAHENIAEGLDALDEQRRQAWEEIFKLKVGDYDPWCMVDGCENETYAVLSDDEKTTLCKPCYRAAVKAAERAALPPGARGRVHGKKKKRRRR